MAIPALQNQSSSDGSLHIHEKIHRASFAGCPPSERKDFINSKCILPISIMGRKEHESNRFAATMRLVNISFKSCTLLVADTLHRISLQIQYPGISKDKLYKMARDVGNSWLERNRASIDILKIPFNIIRWDNCLNHPDFNKHYDAVVKLYDSNESFKLELDSEANKYLNRYMYSEGSSIFDYSHAFNCCVDYLKEECAGMCTWIEYGYDFEIYPTGRSDVLEELYQLLIKPFYPNLLKPVRLRYRKHENLYV